MKEKNFFIMVKDEDTSNKLMKSGFQLISDSNNTYVFQNNSKLMFSDDIDQNKIYYTNKLFFTE